MPSEPVHQMTLQRRFSQRSQSAEERMKAAVVHTAFVRGMWGALGGAVVGGLGMFFANKHNFMGIRHGLGVSGKAGLVVTAAVAPFWLRGELTIIEGMQHPERFEAAAAPPEPVHTEHRTRTLPLWQRALNHVYDSPVTAWASIVVPAYAAIFAFESRNPATASMHLSQRIIHTRVIGQFTAISTLIAIGLTTDTMRKAGGRFELPESDEDDAGAHSAEQTIQQYAHAEKSGGVNWSLLVPLAYAPLLPLLRIGLRGRLPPRQLDLLTGGTIMVALAHAGYIMLGDSTMIAG